MVTVDWADALPAKTDSAAMAMIILFIDKSLSLGSASRTDSRIASEGVPDF